MLWRVLAASCLLGTTCALAQEDTLAARIREANARATKAIVRKWAAVKNHDTTEAQARTLVALTLLRAGGPEERQVARKILDEWWLDAVAGRPGSAADPCSYAGYVVSLGVSALEGLSLERRDDHDDDKSTLTRYDRRPLAPDMKKRLEIAANALMGSAVRGGWGVGWGYHVIPFETGETREARKAPFDADASNTQFAALALHDAARGGVAIPADLVEALAQSYVQEPQGDAPIRWAYLKDPSPSMTFAALSSLAIARSLGSKNDGIETTIKGGLRGMGKLLATAGPSPAGEVGRGAAYSLYSLEKALDLLEIETVDGREWFPEVAERVLKQQRPGGLWGEGDLVDSCLYVLFLVRASFGPSRLGPPQTVVRMSPQADALGAVKAFAEGPSGPARARLEEALEKLAARNEGADAQLLPALAELSKKAATREEAARCLDDLCGKAPTAAELAVSTERLARLGGACEESDLVAALDRTSLLPVRALAAAKGASPEHVLDAADELFPSSLLETPAGSRCAHAFETAVRKSLPGELPPLSSLVKPAELRWFVHVARTLLAETARKADAPRR